MFKDHYSPPKRQLKQGQAGAADDRCQTFSPLQDTLLRCLRGEEVLRYAPPKFIAGYLSLIPEDWRPGAKGNQAAMTSTVHVFTSITANYLPKARVLAESVKSLAPEVQFHLVLSDVLPPGFEIAGEPFDSVILATDLAATVTPGWLFSHTVVELCTAVKGLSFEYIFDQVGADKVFFFDPDMVVFDRFHELVGALDHSSILLTPHQTAPECDDEAIMDNEMASLIFGVFNLGFLGVRNDEEGRRFSGWWRDRLLRYCHDDRPRGLFTDQKWVNLAPCYFDGIQVLRSPAFNVATWNLSQRRATGSVTEGILINGEPLGFYHFSGFDSGAQEIMLNKYGADSPVLFELRDWYIDACEQRGQSELGALPSQYASYADESPISLPERVLYRQRADLQAAFPDPFAVDANGGYRGWFQANAVGAASIDRTVSIDPAGPLADMLNAIGFCFAARSHEVQSPLKRSLLQFVERALRLSARLFA